jgi:hypothetical protein
LPTERRDLSAVRGRDIFRLCRRARLAADCLLALRLSVPNEAHMLSALHLARGGTHVTLNFDIGIELAYEVLTGGEAAKALPEPYCSAVAGWRALAPAKVPALRVVASHQSSMLG